MARDKKKIEDLLRGIRSSSRLDNPMVARYLSDFIELLDRELEIRRDEIENIENRNERDGLRTNAKDRDVNMKKIIEAVIDGIARNNDPINLIPSDHKTKCHHFLLAIAGAGFGREKGFKGIMRDTVQHWFRCENKETLILTLDWDDNKFKNDWLGIIQAYESRGHEVFVIQYGEYNVMQHYPVR